MVSKAKGEMVAEIRDYASNPSDSISEQDICGRKMHFILRFFGTLLLLPLEFIRFSTCGLILIFVLSLIFLILALFLFLIKLWDSVFLTGDFIVAKSV